MSILLKAISAIVHPAAAVREELLYTADKLGAHSHVTNALRDLNLRFANLPIILGEAVKNYVTGQDKTFKEAYKRADTLPSKVAQTLLVIPNVNTEKNYSDDELKVMGLLDNLSGGRSGQITSTGYKKLNNSRYAGDIHDGEFTSPGNVVEWSIGLSSGVKDKETGKQVLSDVFAFDKKDNETYLNNLKSGNGNAVQAARLAMGILGSQGYEDNSNSYTAIKTRIPVSAYKKLQGGIINYFDYVD